MEISNESDISLEQNDILCRVCLSVSEKNKCIFASNMTRENDSLFPGLWEKLRFYGGIEVTWGDGLPTKICDKCLSNIQVAHDFRLRCQESDKKLRSMLKKITNESEENPLERRVEDIGESKDPYVEKSATSLKSEISDSCQDSHDGSILSVTSRSIDPKKVRESSPVTQREPVPPRRLVIIKKSISEDPREPWKIRAETSITSDEPESSKIVADKVDNSSKKIARSSDDNSTSNVDEKRARGLIVFGRMTSMVNLKNRKELQRRYVKKAYLTRKTSDDREKSRISNKQKRSNGTRVQSDLTVSYYKCDKCYKSYESKKSLEEHQFSHDPEKFSCDQCDERFGKLVEFLEHARSHELKEKLKPAFCQICNKFFRKAVTMVRHLHTHKRDHPRAVYAILKEIRDKRDIRDKTLKFNKPGRAERKEFSRNRDDESFVETSNDEFREKSPKDRDRTAYNFDASGTNENAELSNSSRPDVAVDESATEIPSDDRSAIKLINIWIREELDSDNEGKGFPCNACDKSYVTRKALEKHKSKMHDSFSSRCDICYESCTCPDKTRDGNDNREKMRIYRCKECGKTFERETNLDKHERIHARDKELEDKNFKRFLCHICSKTFRQNTGLMFHMRTHTGYKPHVCKYCGRGFTSNSNCINHERTHTGDRPFVCHFCSAAFAKSCTLKAHITTHTGEANYHCKTCDKSFRRLKYLKEHSYTHTGEKPYACKICGTAYSHSGSLFVHEKKCKAQGINDRDTRENNSDERAIVTGSSDFPIDDSVLPTQNNIPVVASEFATFVDAVQSTNRENVDSRRTKVSADPRHYLPSSAKRLTRN